ncbi:hypothetical protein CL629_00700 [bacterium]|nr:hypothetical protein [bacterium]|tara:strand:- start:503 stop:1714 length:1212 start_codon:yes stop_codon:yes gene_type:complete
MFLENTKGSYSFYNSTKTILAISTLITLIAWISFLALWVRPTEGAALTSVSDTLTDSDIAVASNHTIKFTSPTGVTAGQIIDYHFPTTQASDEFVSSSISGLGLEDFDFVIGSIEQEVTSTFIGCAGSQSVGVTTTASAASTTVRVEICTSNSVSASASTTLEIGTNATASSSGNSQITNPSSTGVYEITIAGGQTDRGSLRVAIIDDVTVTATVDTSFTFTVAGVSAGTACIGTSTAAASTATTIPFGTLTTAASSTLCQTLTVSTNAASGFIVTVFADQTLTSGSNDIDYFADGVQTIVPIGWTAPSATLGSEATYGHWGISSEDINLDADTGTSTDDFVTGIGDGYKHVGNFSSARNIFGHSGPANATSTKIAVTIEISALQEAATDYTATLTYVATPTF